MNEKITDRRSLQERRAGIDRRRMCLLADITERRDDADRRSCNERRSGKDRRKKNPWSRPALNSDATP